MTRKVVSPIALDKSINTTEQTPRNIADVLAQQLEGIKTAIETGNGNLEAAFVCYYGVTTATQIKNAIEDGKVPYFYYNGVVAQLWKVETDKYTFRTTNTRSVEGQTILDIVDYVVNGSVWSTVTREVSGGSSSGQSYIATVKSLADFDTTGYSGMHSVLSVDNVPADGIYQLSVMLHITPKTASATKSDLVFHFTSGDGTGWPNHTFHAVVDDSQTFAQQLSFSTSVSLKAGQNTLRIKCGGLNTEYLVFVDELTLAQLVNGVYHNGDDFADVHTLTEAADFNNDDGVLVDGATGGPRFMFWKTLASKVLGFIKNLVSIADRTKLTKGYFFVLDGPDGTYRLRATDVGGVGLSCNAIKYCYLDVSAGVGSIVDITQRKQSSNFSSVVVPCKTGDVFRIKGTGGNAVRLWGFLDSNGEILDVAAPNTSTSTYITLEAQQDGYFVSNAETDSLAVEFVGFNVTKHDFNGSIADDIELVGTIKNDFTLDTTQDGYITTGVEIGTEVDLSSITTSNDYRSVVKKVYKGDIIRCKGRGGSNPRLWAFVDNNNILLSSSNEGLGVKDTYLTLTAPSDGTFIGAYNINLPTYPGEFFCYYPIQSFKKILEKKLNDLGVDISTINASVYSLSQDILSVSNVVDVIKNSPTYEVNKEWFRECLAVYTNGDTTDFVPRPSTGFKSIVLDCNEGDVFLVTGYGGSSPRLWALTDDEGNIYQKSADSVSGENIRIIATKKGKLVVNTSMSRNINFGIICTSTSGFVEDTIEKRDFVHTMCLAEPSLVEIKNNFDFLDLSEEVGEFDFSYVSRGPTNMLEQVQSKMDALAQEYSSYMTSVDISVETGIPYPRYAQGVPSGDPEYWACPAYVQKLYKLIGNDEGLGNTNGRNPKKKVLIIAGQHGDEIEACVNLYILARRLCEAKDDFYFSLRSSCEFYLFPCVNGYGLHFFNRLNGNHVDINRNYPIRCWAPTTSGFSGGDSACDQFETQCVVKLCDLYNFDIAIDHHNYTNYVVEVENVPQQLYSTTSCLSTLKSIYSSFIDCSFAFIKNMPSFFGTSWKIFTGNHGAPKELQTWLNGTASRWFFESVTDISATIEVSSDINYLNGVPHVGKETEYSVDSFKVAEYTLRTQLINFVKLSFKKLIQTGKIPNS